MSSSLERCQLIISGADQFCVMHTVGDNLLYHYHPCYNSALCVCSPGHGTCSCNATCSCDEGYVGFTCNCPTTKATCINPNPITNNTDDNTQQVSWAMVTSVRDDCIVMIPYGVTVSLLLTQLCSGSGECRCGVCVCSNYGVRSGSYCELCPVSTVVMIMIRTAIHWLTGNTTEIPAWIINTIIQIIQCI